jgi:hypothetical protein
MSATFDSPDTQAMFSQGIVFQTHKAGGDANDAELGTWWDYVKGHRSSVLLGAYWVLYPGDPVARADMFIARLDSQCPGWRNGPFILQADCEKWGGDAGTVPTVGVINAFCDRLADRLPNLVPIVYAPKWVYGNQVSALRYPLWASAYVLGSGTPQHLYPGDSAAQWGRYGGKTPSILQYTSSATIGGQSTCDANAFRGSLAQLIELVAPGWAKGDDMALTADDIKAVAAATVAALTAATPLNGSDGQPDGTTASPVGRAVWGQGLPPQTGAGRVAAWQAVGQIGDALASSTAVDPVAVATALVDAGIGALVAVELISLLSAPAAG